MLTFKSRIQKFEKMGEKSGWTYVIIPAKQAALLSPGNRRSFRIKGKLDAHPISGVAVMPMGEGDFILPLNAAMRKGIRKQVGDQLLLSIEQDKEQKPLNSELLECLADEPEAEAKFNALAPGHQRYFSNWVESAKAVDTRARRIAHALHFLSLGKDYGEMIRALKKEK